MKNNFHLSSKNMECRGLSPRELLLPHIVTGSFTLWVYCNYDVELITKK